MRWSGPTTSPSDRYEEYAMRVTTRLSSIELENVEGESIRLGALWQDKTVVLVFIRHFG